MVCVCWDVGMRPGVGGRWNTDASGFRTAPPPPDTLGVQVIGGTCCGASTSVVPAELITAASACDTCKPQIPLIVCSDPTRRRSPPLLQGPNSSPTARKTSHDRHGARKKQEIHEKFPPPRRDSHSNVDKRSVCGSRSSLLFALSLLLFRLS